MTKQQGTPWTVGEDALSWFASWSGDDNPLHGKDAYARKTPFGERVVYGVVPLFLLSELVQGRSLATMSVQFLRPVFIGDTLIAEIRSQDGENTFAIKRIPRDRASGPTSSPHDDVVVTRGRYTVAPHQRQELETRSAGTAPPIVSPSGRGGWLGDVPSAPRLFPVCGTPIARAGMAPTLPPLLSFEERMFGVFSYIVGKELPGDNALFTGFEVRFLDQPQSETAALSATVSFYSRAARSGSITISGGGIEGQLTFQVRPAKVALPTCVELQDKVPPKLLKGQVWCVVGASRGIGHVTCKVAALAGARVLAVSRHDDDDSRAMLADIQRVVGPESVTFLQADVTSAREREQLGEKIRSLTSGLDVLVYGVAAGFRPQHLLDVTSRDLHRHLTLSVEAPLQLVQLLLPLLSDRRGQVVALGSLAAERPPAEQLPYVVAKGALRALMRSLAVELAPVGVRTHLISPSMVETDLIGALPAAMVALERNKNLLNRLGTPLDVAQAIVGACTGAGMFTTGNEILINGGADLLT